MYALASGGKISEIWMSTIGPAFIFAVGYFVINYFRIGRHQVKPEKVNMAFSEKARQIGKSTFYAIPALLMPIIIYGAIYGGFCTVTEAGAVSCVYGILYFAVLKIINKKKIQITFWRCCAIAGASTAVIGLLNAFSAVAGKVMTLAGISSFLSNLITANISSRWGFLLMINILFIFMGTFMDINATILIMTPLLLPVAQTYGISTVHFGAIMLVNMCVGFLTPPFAVRYLRFHQDRPLHIWRNGQGSHPLYGRGPDRHPGHHPLPAVHQLLCEPACVNSSNEVTVL